MNYIKLASYFAAFICMPAWHSAAHATQYKIRVLDNPIGSTFASADEINNHGQIVGYATPSNLLYRDGSVYLWDSQGVHEIESGFAIGRSIINDSGVIVTGLSVWKNGVKTTLPTFPYSGPYATAFDINNSGIIVGRSLFNLADPNHPYHAALWDSKGIHDLGIYTLSTSTAKDSAWAINDLGQVVGQSGGRAILWSNGKIIDLGALLGYEANIQAYDINNAGQIICNSQKEKYYYTDRDYRRAFLWQNGQTTDIVSPDGRSTVAMKINKLGQIVGYVENNETLDNTPYIWENGNMTMLPTLGHDASASGINDSGIIVGQAIGNDNQYHAVVWEPVPEPCSMLAMLTGITSLGLLRRRSRK